jgi:hypothetical protein
MFLLFLIIVNLITLKTIVNCSDDTKEIGHLVPAFGFMLSSIMYLRIPKCSFLQEVVSIEMYRSGCNQRVRLTKHLFVSGVYI